MKKRIIALVLVLVMVFSSALAVTPYEDIRYVKPDLTEMKQLASKIRLKVTEKNAFDNLLYLFSDMMEEYEEQYTMYQLATIRQYQDATSKTLASETDYAYQVVVDAWELCRATLVHMLESDYQQGFRNYWGDEIVDSFLESEAMTEEERALNATVSGLLAEYNTLSKSPIATINGATVAYEKAKNDFERQEILKLWMQNLGDLYIKMVKVRKQLADGENYLSQTYRSYYRDYTPTNASQLETMVKDALAKVYGKVDRIDNSEAIYQIGFDGVSMEELMQASAYAFLEIDDSLVESFVVMDEYDLYDIEYRENKQSGGFTAVLPMYESPFLYIQPTNPIESIHTFYHEFGHFNQMLRSDMREYWPGSSTDLDAAEVMSQALALMVNGQMDDIFGEELGELMVEYNISSTLFALISGCMVDEFEQYVYSTDDLSYESLTKKFGELCEKYHVSWSDTAWTQIPHIYQSPGYYISYAVSAITAMELWGKYETDPETGVESYLAAVEACQDGYRALLASAKLRNPFSAPELLESIGALVEDYFDIMIDTYGHWAEEDIDLLSSAGVINGYTDANGVSYFRPNQNVTRAEFVKLLYGISMEDELGTVYTSDFSDVNTTDWYAPYIRWAVENGLVNGVSETRFNPNGTITRQDMAVILDRYLKYSDADAEIEATSFADEDRIADYAKDSVAKLKGLEILNGLPDGRFDPNGSVTRAAAVTALVGTRVYIYNDEIEQETSGTFNAPFRPIGRAPIAAQMAVMFIH